MFFLLTGLFSFPLVKDGVEKLNINKPLIAIALLVIVYGLAMEFVQKYLVYLRSFDAIDIVFDSLGSFAGFGVSKQYYRKKIGPDGNRGRNQN